MWYPFLLHPTPRTNLNLHQQRMLPHTFQPFFSVEKVGRLTDRQMQTKGNQRSSVKLSSQMNYKYIPILFYIFLKKHDALWYFIPSQHTTPLYAGVQTLTCSAICTTTSLVRVSNSDLVFGLCFFIVFTISVWGIGFHW